MKVKTLNSLILFSCTYMLVSPPAKIQYFGPFSTFQAFAAVFSCGNLYIRPFASVANALRDSTFPNGDP